MNSSIRWRLSMLTVAAVIAAAAGCRKPAAVPPSTNAGAEADPVSGLTIPAVLECTDVERRAFLTDLHFPTSSAPGVRGPLVGGGGQTSYDGEMYDSIFWVGVTLERGGVDSKIIQLFDRPCLRGERCRELVLETHATLLLELRVGTNRIVDGQGKPMSSAMKHRFPPGVYRLTVHSPGKATTDAAADTPAGRDGG